MQKFNFAATCVSVSREDLDWHHIMKENSKEVKYKTFVNNCKGVLEIAMSLGYSHDERGGLTMKNDFHVGFYKSTWKNKPCFYLTWSGYEYIWTESGSL